MAAVAVVCIVGVVVLIIVISGSSAATTGYDASYPQCSGSYPSNPLFGIVGVNGGLADNANPCISTSCTGRARRRGRSARSSHTCRCTSTPATPERTTSRTGLVAALRRPTVLATAS